MRRCPICGRPVKDTDLCVSCYVERGELVKLNGIIRITRCPRCGFYRIGGKWIDMSFEEAVIRHVRSSMDVHPDFKIRDIEIEKSRKDYSVMIRGYFKGEEVEIRRVVDVRIVRETCKRCSMESGGYYESIVQIRADGRKIEDEEIEKIMEIVRDVMDREGGHQKAFISKIVERKEGIDFYFGDRNIGRKVSRLVVRTLGGRITESKKLHTVLDGREVYRFTYSVRLPCYRVGDVVDENGTICVVINQKDAKALSLDGTTVNLRDPKLIIRREEIRRSVVVGCDEFVVEVLHPVTQRVICARRPKADIAIGSEVFVFEYGNDIYVIPKEIYEGCKSSKT